MCAGGGGGVLVPDPPVAVGCVAGRSMVSRVETSGILGHENRPFVNGRSRGRTAGADTGCRKRSHW